MTTCDVNARLCSPFDPLRSTLLCLLGADREARLCSTDLMRDTDGRYNWDLLRNEAMKSISTSSAGGLVPKGGVIVPYESASDQSPRLLGSRLPAIPEMYSWQLREPSAIQKCVARSQLRCPGQRLPVPSDLKQRGKYADLGAIHKSDGRAQRYVDKLPTRVSPQIGRSAKSGVPAELVKRQSTCSPHFNVPSQNWKITISSKYPLVL